MEDHNNNYELIMEHIKNDKSKVEHIACKRIKAGYIKYMSDEYEIYGEYRSIVEEVAIYLLTKRNSLNQLISV